MKGYIGLGANLGEPVSELRSAVSELESRGIDVERRSSLYRTEPVDVPHGGWFVNAAAAVRFEGTPRELLGVCLAVEASRGRIRTVRNAPRTLDIDVLLLGELLIDEEGLRVPHPRLHERRFVLEPMVELAPDVVHPSLRQTMRELLEACRDTSKVMRLEEAFAR